MRAILYARGLPPGMNPYLRTASRNVSSEWFVPPADVQIAALREDVVRRGWTVEAVHTEDFGSHWRGDADRQARPGYKEMMTSLQPRPKTASGPPDRALVVWRLDRVAPSVDALLTLLATLGERGVAFVSVVEGIDTTTPRGAGFAEATRHMRAMLDCLQIERIRMGRHASAFVEMGAAARRIALTEDEARDAVAKYGTITRAAQRLGVSRAVIRTRLARGCAAADRRVP
jgi:DNA invertase Pin-like site-specific DNA recombinase